MKAKTIKAIDSIIAGLEELKEALESEASKSGGDADDEDTGKVSGRKGTAKAGKVSAAGKKSRPAPDDDDDLDGDADASSEDEDVGDDGDVDPPKGKKPAAKAAPVKGKAAAKGKKTDDDDDGPTLETVKEKLTAVMEEESLGKPKVLAVLKKFGAAKSSDLEEGDYPAVIKACDKLLATVETEDDDV